MGIYNWSLIGLCDSIQMNIKTFRLSYENYIIKKKIYLLIYNNFIAIWKL